MLSRPPPPHGLPRDLRICSVLTHLPLYTSTQTSVYGKVLIYFEQICVSCISFIFFLNSRVLPCEHVFLSSCTELCGGMSNGGFSQPLRMDISMCPG